MIVRVPCGGFCGLIRGLHRAAAAESSPRMPGRPATVLAGQRPGIKEANDGIWIVSFMRDDKPMCPEQTTRKWCRKRDSNPRPPHYECGALPTELLRREMRVPDTGRRPDWQARGKLAATELIRQAAALCSRSGWNPSPSGSAGGNGPRSGWSRRHEAY